MDKSRQPNSKLERIRAKVKSKDIEEARTAAYIYLKEADKAGLALVSNEEVESLEEDVSHLKKELSAWRETVEEYRKRHYDLEVKLRYKNTLIYFLVLVIVGVVLHFLSR